MRELIETKKKLREALGTDPLTGLASKNKMYKELEHSFAILRREQRNRGHRALQDFSIIFIDLDGFKPINDGNHLRGDRILIEFGDYLREITRDVDTVARFGGDEFFILAPNTTQSHAQILCNKIQAGLKSYFFDSKKEPLKLRASVSSASTSEGFTEYMSMIAEADARMDAQKNQRKGR
jgi:diguanylate cyclase (GGDEF)-like protein